MAEWDAKFAHKLREYREFAAQAHKAASEATTFEMRQAQEELARSWELLIKEIEALGRGRH